MCLRSNVYHRKNELCQCSFDKRACVHHGYKQRGTKLRMGLCKSDLRHPERQAGGLRFIPFPKLRRNRGTALEIRWTKARGGN